MSEVCRSDTQMYREVRTQLVAANIVRQVLRPCVYSVELRGNVLIKTCLKKKKKILYDQIQVGK